jgi:hypothetical protein
MNWSEVLLGLATSQIWIGQGDKFKPECPRGFGACSLNILTVMRRCAGPREDWGAWLKVVIRYRGCPSTHEGALQS